MFLISHVILDPSISVFFIVIIQEVITRHFKKVFSTMYKKYVLIWVVIWRLSESNKIIPESKNYQTATSHSQNGVIY